MPKKLTDLQRDIIKVLFGTPNTEQKGEELNSLLSNLGDTKIDIDLSAEAIESVLGKQVMFYDQCFAILQDVVSKNNVKVRSFTCNDRIARNQGSGSFLAVLAPSLQRVDFRGCNLSIESANNILDHLPDSVKEIRFDANPRYVGDSPKNIGHAADMIEKIGEKFPKLVLLGLDIEEDNAKKLEALLNKRSAIKKLYIGNYLDEEGHNIEGWEVKDQLKGLKIANSELSIILKDEELKWSKKELGQEITILDEIWSETVSPYLQMLGSALFVIFNFITFGLALELYHDFKANKDSENGLGSTESSKDIGDENKAINNANGNDWKERVDFKRQNSGDGTRQK